MKTSLSGSERTYDVTLTRVVREHIRITVRATSTAAARRRALQLERYEIDRADGEERRDWTDPDVLTRRPRVAKVEEVSDPGADDDTAIDTPAA